MIRRSGEKLTSVLVQHDAHFRSDIQRGQESLVEAASTNNVYGMFAVTAGAHCEQAQSGRVLKLLQFQERGLVERRATGSGTLESGYPNFAGHCAEDTIIPRESSNSRKV